MDRRALLFVLLTSSMLLFFHWNSAQQPKAPEEKKEVAPAAPPPQGEYYVLETPYQQLVFSTVGGALAEINLPFGEIVHPVAADHEMEENHPEQDRFPQYSARFPNGAAEPQVGGYTPLLRRVGVPRLFALNIVSRFPEVAERVYTVKAFDERSIVFESDRGITKTYRVTDEPYVFEVEIEGDLGRELWLTSGVPELEMVANSPAPSVKYRLLKGNKTEVMKVPLPKGGGAYSIGSIYPEWISNSNGFFGLIMDPLDAMGAGFRVNWVPSTTAPSRLILLNPKRALPGYNLMWPLSGPTKLRMYAGPYSTNILAQVDGVYHNDYRAAKSFHGIFSFISEPFAKLLFVFLSLFHQLTHSWAASIVLLTVLLRVLLYPLSAWSMRSMRRMQKLSPQVAALKERYAKDPRRAQMEIFGLYRQQKVNPFMGCFPLLIQMPFLIGMFDLLKSSFELRGAPFIPGWIDDLSAPDVLFSWTQPIFFIGNQFHLLPILLGAVMFLQQRFSSPLPKDKSLWTDQQRQQRAMSTVMVAFFTLLFYNFPSGLNIYWLSSMLLSMLQQWIVNRQLDRKDEGVGTVSR